MNSAAIIEYCSIIEQVLEHFYKNVWGYLTPDEKQSLVSIERKFGKKSPMETLSLGRWLEFYRESDLSRYLATINNIPPEIFDIETLSRIKEVRNKCTHDDYKPTVGEADNVAAFAEKLLLATHLIDRIPAPFSIAEKESDEAHRFAELVNKIRMIVSAQPTVKYNGEIPEEDGKVYWVDATLEIVGVYGENNTIHLLVIEKNSTIHEDVLDTAYHELFERTWKPVERANPDLRGIKISLDVCTDGASCGDYSCEIQF